MYSFFYIIFKIVPFFEFLIIFIKFLVHDNELYEYTVSAS
jgi:hypothetical protein